MLSSGFDGRETECTMSDFGHRNTTKLMEQEELLKFPFLIARRVVDVLDGSATLIQNCIYTFTCLS